MTKIADVKRTREKSVIILSGGLDSTTLAYDIVARGFCDVYALSFDYGQRHKKELRCALATCKRLNIPHKQVDLSSLAPILSSALTDKSIKVPEGHYAEESMKATVVPNRNMIMLSIAIGYAVSLKAKAVYYGAHAGDHAIYPDCRPEFLQKVAAVAKICDWHSVDVIAPYLHLTKNDIVKLGRKLNVDYALTWTCYKGGVTACGRCGSCCERILAFNAAEMQDPLLYREPWFDAVKRALRTNLKEGHV